jgi:predicted enzyme related to lactoylglutathione lyase
MVEFDKVTAFVPAKDFEQSKRFYSEIFELVREDTKVCEFRAGNGGFLLQDFYQHEFASHCMYRVSCSDLQTTWAKLSQVVAKYDGTSVRPPKNEVWGRVVYLYGPSGELWHVTQAN